MLCEHHKDALIETAATGSAPSGELRAHLAECDSCRAAFDEEQSLFGAIDSSLHAAANAEVPPSLLPRVRASLDEVAVANPRWSSSWFALTGAAMAAVVLFFAISTRQNNLSTSPINSGANHPSVSAIVPSTGSPLSAGSSEKAGSVLQRKVFAAKNSVLPRELVSQESTPEILVPRDQELLVAGYVQQWNSHKHSPLVARDVDESSVAPLEVAPIQITELDVKLLAESNSQ
jgi:hypothetical protein